MIDTLAIYAPGTAVEIGPESHPIEATVLSATIHEQGIVYTVSWWDGRNRIQQGLDPFEVRPVSATARVGLGFVQPRECCDRR